MQLPLQRALTLGSLILFRFHEGLAVLLARRERLLLFLFFLGDHWLLQTAQDQGWTWRILSLLGWMGWRLRNSHRRGEQQPRHDQEAGALCLSAILTVKNRAMLILLLYCCMYQCIVSWPAWRCSGILNPLNFTPWAICRSTLLLHASNMLTRSPHKKRKKFAIQRAIALAFEKNWKKPF